MRGRVVGRPPGSVLMETNRDESFRHAQAASLPLADSSRDAAVAADSFLHRTCRRLIEDRSLNRATAHEASPALLMTDRTARPPPPSEQRELAAGRARHGEQ